MSRVTVSICRSVLVSLLEYKAADIGRAPLERGRKHTLRVDIDGLLAGHRVRANDGVLVHDGVATVDASARHGGGDLLNAGMGGFQAVKAFLEERGEAVVGLYCVDEKGVAAGLGLVQDVQKRGSGGLLLVRDVRVPGYRAGAVGKVGVRALIARSPVDEVDLGEALGGSGCGMDVVAGSRVRMGFSKDGQECKSYRPK